MAGKEPRPGSDFHGHPSVRRFGFRDIQADGRRGARDLHDKFPAAERAAAILKKEFPDVPLFTTAYDEYAIHAFRVNAVDYLLKPLAIDEVKRALEKYRRLNRPPGLPDIEKLYEMISCQRTNSRRNILVAYKDKLLPIPTEKIAFFYSTKETSRVYLADGSNYAYNRTLESICDDMDPRAFCRVNKQYVVAREHITSIVVWSNSRLLVSMDTETPEPVFLSKNRAAEFKKWITG